VRDRGVRAASPRVVKHITKHRQTNQLSFLAPTFVTGCKQGRRPIASAENFRPSRKRATRLIGPATSAPADVGALELSPFSPSSAAIIIFCAASVESQLLCTPFLRLSSAPRALAPPPQPRCRPRAALSGCAGRGTVQRSSPWYTPGSPLIAVWSWVVLVRVCAVKKVLLVQKKYNNQVKTKLKNVHLLACDLGLLRVGGGVKKMRSNVNY
jgi:hypothetical protein